MRYYIYLDKDFLKSVCSVSPDIGFELEVVEFSSKKTYGYVEDLCIEPKIENGIEEENSARCEEEDSLSNSNCNKRRQVDRLDVKTARARNMQTSYERRYINIDEISDIKNAMFFNELINKLLKVVEDKKEFFFEKGKIYPYKLRNIYSQSEDDCFKDVFVKMNDTYIWIDSKKLDVDIEMISNMIEDVSILGYFVRNNIKESYSIVKAIAIFI